MTRPCAAYITVCIAFNHRSLPLGYFLPLQNNFLIYVIPCIVYIRQLTLFLSFGERERQSDISVFHWWGFVKLWIISFPTDKKSCLIVSPQIQLRWHFIYRSYKGKDGSAATHICYVPQIYPIQVILLQNRTRIDLECLDCKSCNCLHSYCNPKQQS